MVEFVVINRTSTDSSKDVINPNRQLLSKDGLTSGSTTLMTAWKLVAPSTLAASYWDTSSPARPADINVTTMGMARQVCATTTVQNFPTIPATPNTLYMDTATMTAGIIMGICIISFGHLVLTMTFLDTPSALNVPNVKEHTIVVKAIFTLVNAALTHLVLSKNSSYHRNEKPWGGKDSMVPLVKDMGITMRIGNTRKSRTSPEMI